MKNSRTHTLLHVLLLLLRPRRLAGLGDGVGAHVGAHDEVRQALVGDGVHDVLWFCVFCFVLLVWVVGLCVFGWWWW